MAHTPEALTQLTLFSKSGNRLKKREVWEPNDEMRAKHRNMLSFLYATDITLPYATGSMPGMQLRDNVLPHKDNTNFYLLDLQDAFLGVDIDYLHGLVERQFPVCDTNQEPVSAVIHEFIDEYGTIDGVPGLPLGLPCSPLLFNIYCKEMDYQVGKYCESWGMTYTRYLDDLTISSPAGTVIGTKKRKIIRDKIISTPGMSINHTKSKVLTRGPWPVTITGISLYPDGTMQAAPHLIEKAIAEINAYKEKLSSGEEVTEHDEGVLAGWLGVMEQLSDPDAKTRPMQSKLARECLYLLGIQRVTMFDQSPCS